MSDSRLFITLMMGMFGFLLLLTVSLSISDYQQKKENTEQMKVCVEAGKTWVRNGHTDNYDCM